jgi:histidinol-phosphate aminotransferase
LALEAIRENLDQLHRYVDPAAPELVETIAAKFHIRSGRIICGHGTDALLGYILNASTQPEDEILTCEGTFIGMYVNVHKFGRRLSLVPLKNYAFDLDRILAGITDQTRAIYLTNPNNPTGTIFTKKEFDGFLSGVPENVLIILDEAYAEYAAFSQNYPDGLKYERDNLIILRTLSKTYGLAGLRVGFAVGPEYLIQQIYKVKLPFEPNYLAQKAAIAALEDEDFIRKTVETNRRSIKKMQAKFDSLGIRHVPTWANFLMLLLPSEQIARDFFEECLNYGLIVRNLNRFGIPPGIRINSGTEEETEFALNVIDKVWRKLGSSQNQTEIISTRAGK